VPSELGHITTIEAFKKNWIRDLG